MEEFTLTCEALSHTVKEILTYFVEHWEISRKMKYNHIDITLVNSGGNYTILISNYGQNDFEVNSFAERIFRHFIGSSPSKTDIQLAFIHKKNCAEQVNYTVYLTQNTLITKRDEENVVLVNCALWKKYLSVELKHKLSVKDTGLFKDVVSKHLISFAERTANIKYTLRCERKLIYTNYVQLDNDVKCCEILSNGLVNVIKQSVNIEFTEKCFQLLNVNNSHEAKKVLMAKMLPMIHDNYIFPEVNYNTNKNK